MTNEQKRDLLWSDRPAGDGLYLARITFGSGERKYDTYRVAQVTGDEFRLYSNAMPGLELVLHPVARQDCGWLGPLPERKQ